MTRPDPTKNAAQRRPRLFDPAAAVIVEKPNDPLAEQSTGRKADVPPVSLPNRKSVAQGFAWGALLVSAMAALAALAASLSFARFVAIALQRNDWLGWTAVTLLGIGLAAGAVILGRELVGLFRLRRLGGIRLAAEKALASRDVKAEAAVIASLIDVLSARPELAWSIERLLAHQRDVRDPGDLLALADRDVLAALDADARRIVLSSAKRVATFTALSPMALIAVAFVAIENVRLMRALAALYGGRPGVIGALRLARLVISHLIATGGVALTDDLLGQFLGQDVLRRLSRRLGEGAFNGALTARLGTAAVEVIRPLPFITAQPLRARDFIAELFRRQPPGKSAAVAPQAQTER
jgi:putative membrane protein